MNKTKIKLSVPLNWQEDFIAKFPNATIVELYGRLNCDFVGGSIICNTVTGPFFSKKKLASYIIQIHKQGLKFNYVLDGTCLDNLEWTRSGQRKIRSFLDWLVKAQTDSITVSIPYLVELIRKCYSNLKIEVSQFAEVDTIQRARRWLDLGVDVITLAPYIIRDFELLKIICNNLDCQLQLIVNDFSLASCISYSYYANRNTHLSQIFHRSRGSLPPSCESQVVDNTINSQRIKPEDINIYEEIGIDRIKLIASNVVNEGICKLIKAYSR